MRKFDKNGGSVDVDPADIAALERWAKNGYTLDVNPDLAAAAQREAARIAKQSVPVSQG